MPANESPPDSETEGLEPFPSGWVRIGDRRWWSSWAGFGTMFFVVIGTYGATQLGRFFEDIAPWPSNLILGALAAGALLVGVTLIRNVRYPQPWVNLDTDEFRAGSHRTLRLDHIDRALIPADPAVQAEVLTLRLTAKEARVEIILRDRKGPRLDEPSTRVLTEALRRSSIAMPTSPHDPTGKFARYNFPGHIDLDDTLTLVARPPAPGMPLPASW